ncbi:MAG: dethiobiotin synthase [Gammaproteobacteria bacterium]|nr:dethiobiotin synthase [Gammaproteobacteria bacterium]
MDCFITGTDTGAGKTLVTRALLHALAVHHPRVAALKPIAAGLGQYDGETLNEDVALLRQAASARLALDLINPYAFAAPTAPHLAAAAAGVRIEVDLIAQRYRLAQAHTQVLLVEGVGGWCLPLNEQQMLSDLVKALALPVILVAGIRLGALNHTLLSVRAILADGCALIGWVANIVDPSYLYAQATVAALQARIQAPLLGTVPWEVGGDPRVVAAHLARAGELLATPRSRVQKGEADG